MAAPAKKQSKRQGIAASGRAGVDRRAWFLLLAIVLFVIATVAAWRQPPRADVWASPTMGDWDWWVKPIEHNAFKRLPVIEGDLNDVFALPDGRHVWAVGDNGLIVHSADGGLSWTQQKLPDDAQWAVQCETNSDCDDGLFCNGSETCDNWGKCKGGTPPCTFEQFCDEKLDQCKYETLYPFTTTTPVEKKQSRPPPRSSSAESNMGPNSGARRGVIRRPELQSVIFVDSSHGWIVGELGTVFVTVNGGADWEAQSSGAMNYLWSVHFVDTTRGWAVGGGGTIIATTDGGHNWTKQSSGTETPLRSVHFVDAKRGWAAGWGGIILATTDGGLNWRTQTSGTRNDLSSVYFVDATRGWGVGRKGIILATADGGQNWNTQGSVSDKIFVSVQFTDATRGWVVGWDGTILTTTDGGHNWKTQVSGAKYSLNSVHFIDTSRGWAVEKIGKILATSDGAQTWNLQAGKTGAWFSTLHFVNASHGWIFGPLNFNLFTKDGGGTWRRVVDNPPFRITDTDFVDSQHGWGISGTEVVTTTNGGATWIEQRTGRGTSLSSLDFVDSKHGWCVGELGTILATADSGATWTLQRYEGAPYYSAVSFVDTVHGWVVGQGGEVRATTNGGENWELQESGTMNHLRSIQFVNLLRGWTVGDNGTILATTNGGLNWKPQTSGTSSDLESVHFFDATRGWAVGRSGIILATTDGGQNWKPQTSGTSSDLESVHFVNATRGWTVGLGTILGTNDGGKTWASIQYRRYAAPWYYFACVPPIVFLSLVFRKPKKVTTVERSIDNILASDRPIEAGDPDPLEFTRLAGGLSNYLRNTKTEPPLTLAITGEWGTGKSSLMNLLKADLERYGFRPVWFNAWHHQKEEHLLAAMLQSIRQQAIPPWWSFEGLRFRSRLAAGRARKHWLRVGIALLVTGLCGGYLYTQVKEGRFSFDLTGVWETVTAVPARIIQLLGQKNNGGEAATSQGLMLDVLIALLGATATPLVGIIKSLVAFASKPGRLLAAQSGSASVSALDAQTSFRHRFAQEFKEVTTALNPYTLTIFIDDLDRCRPENVMETLESVNFLTSSGDCFVVLGMARERVTRCVGLAYKDVAEELVEEPAGGAQDKPADGSARRVAFARQYLEKLINVEVPVPTMTNAQATQLAKEDRDVDRWEANGVRGARARFTALKRVGIAASVLIILGAGGFWGTQLGRPTEPAVPLASAAASSAQQSPENPREEPEFGPQPELGDKSARPGLDSERTGKGILVPGQSDGPDWKRYSFPALLLIPAIWWLTVRHDPTVRDSPLFEQALEIWLPVVLEAGNTPRKVKRFINRMRFLAMIQRPVEPSLTRWERFWANLGIKTPSSVLAGADGQLKEDVLVGLGAIIELNPKYSVHWWPYAAPERLRVEDNQLGTQPVEREVSLDRDIAIMLEASKMAITRSNEDSKSSKSETEKFTWPPKKEQLYAFLSFAEGVHIRGSLQTDQEKSEMEPTGDQETGQAA